MKVKKDGFIEVYNKKESERYIVEDENEKQNKEKDSEREWKMERK